MHGMLGFPSPHPGIINFFQIFQMISLKCWGVSVPSSGDYQFLLRILLMVSTADKFPSPHPGIINFFGTDEQIESIKIWFPSPHPGIINFFPESQDHQSPQPQVSVPSSGDYQFLRLCPCRSLLRLYGFRPLIRGLSISSEYL